MSYKSMNKSISVYRIESGKIELMEFSELAVQVSFCPCKWS